MKSTSKVKEIVANRITLESPQGKTRVLLDASSEKTVSLNLFGQGSSSLAICIDSDGNPKIGFTNKKRREAISIGISDDVGHGIIIHDYGGRPILFISVSEDDTPQIKLF
jgi:hypothetical protein